MAAAVSTALRTFVKQTLPPNFNVVNVLNCLHCLPAGWLTTAEISGLLSKDHYLLAYTAILKQLLLCRPDLLIER